MMLFILVIGILLGLFLCFPANQPIANVASRPAIFRPLLPIQPQQTFSPVIQTTLSPQTTPTPVTLPAQKQVLIHTGIQYDQRQQLPRRVLSRLQPSRRQQRGQPRKRLVGIVYSESTSDDSIFELYKKEYRYNRHKFIYTVKNTFTGIEIQLNGGKEIKELYSDDKVSILSKESVGEFVVRLNKPVPITREPINSDFVLVGIVYSESETDDSIYSLYQQDYYLQRDRYVYKIQDKVHRIELPLFFQEPVKKLETGDLITIDAKESIGKFKVQLNEI
jgi:hypothetical protein